MNGGNNPGIYTTTQAPSGAAPKDAIATSNPPVTLDTPEEKSAFKKWLSKTEEELREAIKHPVEGGKGVAKGIGNTPSSLGDLLLKAAAEQRASELDEAAMMQNLFGLTDAANVQTEMARQTRANASKIDLPKFTMNNPAQEGGDKISMAVQIFAGGVGIVKGAASWLGALGKGGATGVATATKAAAGRNGVKIVADSPKSKTVDIATLRSANAKDIDSASTFRTTGLERAKADVFLESPAGIKYLDELTIADPSANPRTIYDRALEQLASGTHVPNLETTTSPLVKIVPQGQTVSQYSPFFTTSEELAAARTSGRSLADYFGLPIKSEAAVYDVYQITPLREASVFISKVGPTSELNGLVQHAGGAVQYVLPNRAGWTQPVHIGTIGN
jgi:hypothetical protein